MFWLLIRHYREKFQMSKIFINLVDKSYYCLIMLDINRCCQIIFIIVRYFSILTEAYFSVRVQLKPKPSSISKLLVDSLLVNFYEVFFVLLVRHATGENKVT